MPDDLYFILGLRPWCTQEDIKQAYRKFAKLYHPDVNNSAGASEKMKILNLAYATLSDPIKRQAYDEHRKTTATQKKKGYDEDYRGTWRPVPPDYRQAKSNFIINALKKSIVQTYAIFFILLILAGSIYHIYPNITDMDSFFAKASSPAAIPTMAPALASTVDPTSMATPFPRAVAITPTPVPSPTPLPSPAIAAAANKSKQHMKAAAPPMAGAIGKGIVTGKVRVGNTAIQAYGSYVAICDADDPAREYYTTTAGMSGYFQFGAVNNTISRNGTLEKPYVLYVLNNVTKNETYSEPFGVRPYRIVEEDVTIPGTGI